MEDQVLKLAEVAIQLKVTYRTVLSYISTGKLRGIRCGGQWRILQSEVHRFILEGNLKEGI